MLSVIYAECLKQDLMLIIVMLSVTLLNVVMLNVVAPTQCFLKYIHFSKCGAFSVIRVTQRRHVYNIRVASKVPLTQLIL
jgi:hypothetical protein